MMNEEKGSAEDQDFGADDSTEDKRKSHSASRARNRTVMLTPEMTGQVRALLHQEPAAEQKPTDALEDFLPPLVDWNSTASMAQQQPEPNGTPEEEPKSGRSTAKMRRDAINEVIDESSRASSEPPVYDPLTMVAPPVRRQPPSTPKPAVETPPQPARSSVQPVFSVNPQSAPSAQAPAPRARATVSAQPAAPVHAGPHRSVGKSKIVAFLISFDSDKNGEVYEIRAGRWLLTSRPTDHGEYILIDDETISPLHAIIRATKDGKLQVLDQLSEYGTSVFRAKTGEEIEIAGGLEAVNHGDTIRFGERYFVVSTVPEPSVVPEEKEKSE